MTNLNVLAREAEELTADAGRAYRIGITLGLIETDEGLWINGIKQNVLSLARLFLNSPRGHQVFLLNTTAVAITPGLPWDQTTFPTLPLADGLDAIDVLIVLGGAVDSATVARAQSAGIRVIGYKCGCEYVMSMQAALFNRAIPGIPTYPDNYDAIWAIPQVVPTSRPFWEVLHRRPVKTVPFVWDPTSFDQAAASQPNQGKYVAGKRPKRISIFEQNHDVVKYALYPLMIAELVFRQRPELIDFISITNTRSLRQNAEFIAVVGHLDLVRQGRAFFEDRYATPWFLAHHTDIVVSHQWENPLNYTYLEVCRSNYPLVHNAALVPDLGYYYAGFDLEAGACQLLRALEQHDQAAEIYNSTQLRASAKYLASNKVLVQTYDALLDGVMGSRSSVLSQTSGST